MPFHSRSAPFTFEPASPNESEIYSGISCSEDELDEVARASKRRRIEQRAQEYLDGKELRILSASLKGPFGKNWTNPWRRTKPQTKSAGDAKIFNKPEIASATPSIGIKLERPEVKSTTTTPGLGKELSSSIVLDPHDWAKKSKVKEQGSSRKAAKGARAVSDSCKTSIFCVRNQDGHLAQAGRTHSAISRQGWLKRRPENHSHIEPPRSPSPTPISRSRDIRAPAKVAPKSLDTSGFTAINQRQNNFAKATSHATTSSSTLDSLPRDDDSNYVRRASKSHKISTVGDLAVLGNDSRGETSLGQPIRDPRGEAVGAGTKVLRISSPRNGDRFEFEYRRPNLCNGVSTKTGKGSSTARNRLNGTPKPLEPGVSFCDFADRAQRPVSVIAGHVQVGSRAVQTKDANERDVQESDSSSDADSFSAPNTFAIDAGTAETVESHNITSAQPPPEYAKVPTEAVSLQSTCFAELKGNTIDTNRDKENEDIHLSTQEAVFSAQRSFQDALAIPDEEPQQDNPASAIKRSPKRTGSGEHSARPAQTITPFGAVESSTSKDEANYCNNPTSEQPINTQVMVDGISPFAVSMAKKIRNRVSFQSNTESGTPSGQKRPGMASTPLLDETSPVSPFEIPGFELGTETKSTTSPQSNHAPIIVPHDPLAQGPGESLPPPTATASTGTKQDGQLVEDLDNFDLSQAIADAGTFLQSWDIEKDLRKFSGNARPSASVPERQPVLSLDG